LIQQEGLAQPLPGQLLLLLRLLLVWTADPLARPAVC
jgi:hypothetical protein